MLLSVVLSLVMACQAMVMPSVQQTTLMEQEQKIAEVTTAELRRFWSMALPLSSMPAHTWNIRSATSPVR